MMRPLVKLDLLADLQHLVPAGLAQGRRDELGADVAFAQAALVETGLENWRFPCWLG